MVIIQKIIEYINFIYIHYTNVIIISDIKLAVLSHSTAGLNSLKSISFIFYEFLALSIIESASIFVNPPTIDGADTPGHQALLIQSTSKDKNICSI